MKGAILRHCVAGHVLGLICFSLLHFIYECRMGRGVVRVPHCIYHSPCSSAIMPLVLLYAMLLLTECDQAWVQVLPSLSLSPSPPPIHLKMAAIRLCVRKCWQGYSKSPRLYLFVWDKGRDMKALWSIVLRYSDAPRKPKDYSRRSVRVYVV